MAAPDGFYYESLALTPQHAASVLKWCVDQALTCWFTAPGERRVLQYGHWFDYKTHKLSPFDLDSEWAVIPETLTSLLQTQGLDPRDFDQCIVNLYEAGIGIARHVDADCFGNTVVVFTLGAVDPVTLAYGPRKYTFTPAVGSVYTLMDEARWLWSHQVDPSPTRSCHRVSVTFRSVKVDRKKTKRLVFMR